MVLEKKIYIVGDSKISTLVSGFISNDLLKDYTIYEATKGGCPLLLYNCDFIPEKKGTIPYLRLKTQ